MYWMNIFMCLGVLRIQGLGQSMSLFYSVSAAYSSWNCMQQFWKRFAQPWSPIWLLCTKWVNMKKYSLILFWIWYYLSSHYVVEYLKVCWCILANHFWFVCVANATSYENNKQKISTDTVACIIPIATASIPPPAVNLWLVIDALQMLWISWNHVHHISKSHMETNHLHVSKQVLSTGDMIGYFSPSKAKYVIGIHGSFRQTI